MVVGFPNYDYIRLIRGKKVFVPSERCRSVGRQVVREIKSKVALNENLYSFRRGGHVSALHSHLSSRFFCKIDLQNYFYHIGRNRIYVIFRKYEFTRPFYFSRWSTVLNPYDGPKYSLPYGFIQSPLVSAVILQESALGKFLQGLDGDVNVAIYVDDISLSSNNEAALMSAFQGVIREAKSSGFVINDQKTIPITSHIETFNCSLTYGSTSVLESRRTKFYATERTEDSIAAFEAYCKKVHKNS